MIPRKFIKDSSIICVSAPEPGIATLLSGMFLVSSHHIVHKILSAGASHVGILSILRAFAGNETYYVVQSV